MEDHRFWKHGQGSGNIFEMPVNQGSLLSMLPDGRNGILVESYISIIDIISSSTAQGGGGSFRIGNL